MKIIFLGDSITEWNSDLKNIENSENYGVAGFTTTDMIWQLRGDEEEIISGERAVLMIGVNDLLNRIDKERVVSNIEDIILELKKRFSKIILISILPTDSLDLNNSIKYINSSLKNNENVIFLDLYDLLLDKNGVINYIYTTDGAHLNNYGYEIFNQKLFTFLKI